MRLALDNILLITQFPPWTDKAVPYALNLVQEHDADVHIAHPVSTDFLEKVTPITTLKGHRNSWRDAIFRVNARRMLLDAAELETAVSGMFAHHDYDLLVVGAGQPRHGHVPLGKLIGPLLEIADCPLLIVGPGIAPNYVPRAEPATILYATDFSRSAVMALSHASSWAQEYQSRMTMLHVVEGLGIWTENERGRIEVPFRQWMRESVPDEMPLWCEVDQRVEFGSPGPIVVRAGTELEADLIVIGSRGFDSFSGHQLGTTAMHVIENATCPVLLVSEKIALRESSPDQRERRSNRLMELAA